MIKSTIETMRPFLRTMQVQLDLREAGLAENQRGLSSALKINGKNMEGALHEAPPREALVDAILKEAARFVRSGCGCAPEDLSR